MCEAKALQSHLACGSSLSSVVEWEDRSPTLWGCWGTRQGDVGRVNLRTQCSQMFESLELRTQMNLGMVGGNCMAWSEGPRDAVVLFWYLEVTFVGMGEFLSSSK